MTKTTQIDSRMTPKTASISFQMREAVRRLSKKRARAERLLLLVLHVEAELLPAPPDSSGNIFGAGWRTLEIANEYAGKTHVEDL